MPRGKMIPLLVFNDIKMIVIIHNLMLHIKYMETPK